MYIQMPSRTVLDAEIQRVMMGWGSSQVRAFREAFLFGGHQTRGGQRWVERKRNYPHPLLLKTGALRRSLGRRPIRNRGVALVADAEYAGFHQEGTKHLPARKIVDITDSDLNKLTKLLKRNLERRIRRGT
jgi:phage gpG-like protein